jgi:hypothetical protein
MVAFAWFSFMAIVELGVIAQGSYWKDGVRLTESRSVWIDHDKHGFQEFWFSAKTSPVGHRDVMS